MTAPDEFLAPIRRRGEAYTAHVTPGYHAPQDRARLLAALDGVLALHQPERGTVHDPDDGETKEMDFCETCSDSQWLEEAAAVAWPCPTVTAITTALEGQA